MIRELQDTAREGASLLCQQALAEAIVALAEDDHETALTRVSWAKERAPRSGVVREVLALAYYRSGDYRGARAELDAAGRLGRSAKPSIAVRADVERGLGRPERAVEIYETADLQTLDPEVRVELIVVAASAFGDLGSPAAGVALLRRAVPWRGEGGEAQLRATYVEGTLAEAAGDLDGARRAYARVATADPVFSDVAERLSSLSSPRPRSPRNS